MKFSCISVPDGFFMKGRHMRVLLCVTLVLSALTVTDASLTSKVNLDPSLVGTQARAEMLASIRAAARGPCENTGQACTANVPGGNNSGACLIADDSIGCKYSGKACGTCTGPSNQHCAGTSEIDDCFMVADTCCTMQKKCTTCAGGCCCYPGQPGMASGSRDLCE